MHIVIVFAIFYFFTVFPIDDQTLIIRSITPSHIMDFPITVLKSSNPYYLDLLPPSKS